MNWNGPAEPAIPPPPPPPPVPGRRGPPLPSTTVRNTSTWRASPAATASTALWTAPSGPAVSTPALRQLSDSRSASCSSAPIAPPNDPPKPG